MRAWPSCSNTETIRLCNSVRQGKPKMNVAQTEDEGTVGASGTRSSVVDSKQEMRQTKTASSYIQDVVTNDQKWRNGSLGALPWTRSGSFAVTDAVGQSARTSTSSSSRCRSVYTTDSRRECFQHTEEGKANKSNAALKQPQRQLRARAMLEISRGVQGFTFEVLRIFQRQGQAARHGIRRNRSMRNVACGGGEGGEGHNSCSICRKSSCMWTSTASRRRRRRSRANT